MTAKDGSLAVEPDLGDLVIVLLAGTLAGLRDRLGADGFQRSADLIADLVEIVDCYLTEVPERDWEASTAEG